MALQDASPEKCGAQHSKLAIASKSDFSQRLHIERTGNARDIRDVLAHVYSRMSGEIWKLHALGFRLLQT